MMVVKRTRSKANFLAMGFPDQTSSADLLADEPGEDLAPVVEVAELIEARAGRREDDDLARPRLPGGGLDRAVQGLRHLVRRATPKRPLEFPGGLADQVNPARLALDQGGEGGEVGPLVAAAQDQVDRAVRKPFERLGGRRRVGALGIVVPEDAS